MDVLARYDCPRCWGTGSLESSDSTEDGWWDCSTCEGTGKLADRRRPDQQLQGAVEAERERIVALIRREASETFDMPLDHELRTLADRIAAGGQ
jgi:DnaJ-class molecular chaperone